uniref:Putative group i salivary lipocalin n=1 Tax=Rhipicephalus pulchellus TaxID=72859 RepID=L7LT94_RHIPC
MYYILLTILCFPVVSSQGVSTARTKMWQLHELLNTTNRIWLFSTSQPVLYQRQEVSCIYYRTKNLTDTNVVLLYSVVYNHSEHKFTVMADLHEQPNPSMNMTDWNGIPVRKDLEYWNPHLKFGIFFVYLQDDKNAAPWCELHVQGPALRAIYRQNPPLPTTTWDQKFYQICGQGKKQIILFNKECPNVSFNSSQPAEATSGR